MSLIRRVSGSRQIPYPFGWPGWGGHCSALHSQVPSCAVIEPVARNFGVPQGWLPLICRSQPTRREPFQTPHGLVQTRAAVTASGSPSNRTGSQARARSPPASLKSRYGPGARSKRFDRVREPAPGCDTAREVSHLLDRIAILGIGTHSGFVPSGGPFSTPAGPLAQGSRRIRSKSSHAHTYKDGQFLNQRIAHMSTVVH
jgi:hypothetical protein